VENSCTILFHSEVVTQFWYSLSYSPNEVDLLHSFPKRGPNGLLKIKLPPPPSRFQRCYCVHFVKCIGEITLRFPSRQFVSIPSVISSSYSATSAEQSCPVPSFPPSESRRRLGFGFLPCQGGRPARRGDPGACASHASHRRLILPPSSSGQGSNLGPLVDPLATGTSLYPLVVTHLPSFFFLLSCDATGPRYSVHPFSLFPPADRVSKVFAHFRRIVLSRLALEKPDPPPAVLLIPLSCSFPGRWKGLCIL